VAKGAIQVLGDITPLLNHSKPAVRKDIVRVGNFGSKKPCTRHRPMFEKWEVKLTIQYNSSVVTAEQLFHLINIAGFHEGCGEWRPGKTGNSFGMYSVA
jgi:hypothetical protein